MKTKQSTKVKKKLCWNCEGNAPYEAENCPYCGVYLSPMSLGNQEGKQNLFAPPYKMSESKEDQEVPASPFVAKEAEKEAEEEAKAESNSSEEQPKAIDDGMKKILVSLILLLAGSVFLLFSIVLLLFSQEGVLTLHWDSGIWFIYLIAGLPMLFIGWRYLQNLRED
jgi:hypothetical protein